MSKLLYFGVLLAAGLSNAANCGPQDLLSLTGGKTFEDGILYAGREAMCGHDACSVQAGKCTQFLRLSNDFSVTMTAVDPNSKWTHCYDAFVSDPPISPGAIAHFPHR
jgi:hypothetical protein